MKQIINRGWLLAVLLLGMAFGMAAQSVQLNVTMQDGSEQAFSLSGNDRVYFEDNAFLVVEGGSNAKSTVRIALSDIRKMTCDEFVGIEEDSANGVGISPNPVHEMLKINNLSGTQAISIYAIDGRLVSSFETDGSQPIDVSRLPIGIYLVKTQSATLKMIKL